MELFVNLAQLCLTLSILIAGAAANPVDMDDIKMGVLAGAGMAADMAQSINPQMAVGGKVKAGDFEVEKEMKASARDVKTIESSEEDSRRRRRSINDDDAVLTPATSGEHRHKRSPCFAKKRAQQATTTSAPDQEDLPRRRKRSMDGNDFDENAEIIPQDNGQAKKFNDRAKEFFQSVDQMMQKAFNTMADAIKNLTENISNQNKAQ